MIIFEPEGRKVGVTRGITIFQTAKEAGVGIRSECSGKGSCGKCKIIIKDPKTIGEVSEAETKHLSSSEIDSGYRLAYQTTILQNTTVMIPQESRIGFRKIQITDLERSVKLEPALRKFHFTPPKPMLFDFRPDIERLLQELSHMFDVRRLKIDYNVLKKISDILRDANWDITTTVWNDRKIIAVESEDTTNELFGLAVDIGTSKIVGYTVDLTIGETIGIGSVENPQVIHDEDIMSRIAFLLFYCSYLFFDGT